MGWLEKFFDRDDDTDPSDDEMLEALKRADGAELPLTSEEVELMEELGEDPENLLNTAQEDTDCHRLTDPHHSQTEAAGDAVGSRSDEENPRKSAP